MNKEKEKIIPFLMFVIIAVIMVILLYLLGPVKFFIYVGIFLYFLNLVATSNKRVPPHGRQSGGYFK